MLLSERVNKDLFWRLAGCLCVIAAMSSGATARQDASQSNSHYAKIDGNRVYYTSYGKGRTGLVLIHGWTCNQDFWKGQIQDFEKRTRVLALDLPGHGRSDKPEIAYTMDLFARAVEAVMRDAGVERAVLVGHSMGTPVARQFYRKYPEKTLGIVIVDGGLRPLGDKKAMEPFIAMIRAPSFKEQAPKMIEMMLGPQVTPDLRQEITAAMLSTPQRVAISAMEGMMDDSIWKPDRIDVPVLAAMAKSPFLQPDNEQFFRSLIAKLDYKVWEGVGHFLMMEKPKEFNVAVIEYLNKYELLKK